MHIPTTTAISKWCHCQELWALSSRKGLRCRLIFTLTRWAGTATTTTRENVTKIQNCFPPFSSSIRTIGFVLAHSTYQVFCSLFIFNKIRMEWGIKVVFKRVDCSYFLQFESQFCLWSSIELERIPRVFFDAVTLKSKRNVFKTCNFQPRRNNGFQKLVNFENKVR